MKKKTSKYNKVLKTSNTGVRKIILPVLGDSHYKYNPKEVSGMCKNVRENLTVSSRKAFDTLNSIVILK